MAYGDIKHDSDVASDKNANRSGDKSDFGGALVRDLGRFLHGVFGDKSDLGGGAVRERESFPEIAPSPEGAIFREEKGFSRIEGIERRDDDQGPVRAGVSARDGSGEAERPIANGPMANGGYMAVEARKAQAEIDRMSPEAYDQWSRDRATAFENIERDRKITDAEYLKGFAVPKDKYSDLVDGPGEAERTKATALKVLERRMAWEGFKQRCGEVWNSEEGKTAREVTLHVLGLANKDQASQHGPELRRQAENEATEKDRREWQRRQWIEDERRRDDERRDDEMWRREDERPRK
jgi:hypothetical protein